MFQAQSALVVTSLLVAITPAYAASSHYERGDYVSHDAAPTARTSQDVESITEVYFIVALSAMALLFVALAFIALSGNRNNVSGSSGDGVGLEIAREGYPFSLSSLGMDPEKFLSIINSVSR